jgi:Predicted transcriptional regulators
MVKYQKVELDRMLYAISDSTRRRILDELIRGEQSVGELSLHFKISLPALLKHIRILKETELITTKKVGRRVMCNILGENLIRVSTWLSKYQRFWEERLHELEAQIRSNTDKKDA